METILIVVLFLLLVLNGVLVWLFVKKSAPPIPTEKADDKAMNLLLQQMNALSDVVDRRVGDLNRDLNKTLDAKIGETSKHVSESLRANSDSMHKQFGESAKLIRDVTEGLTKLDETNKQVVSFADQLQSLQDILKNPKQRGILGEYYLETLLKNVFAPNEFQMQYPFPDGTIVDAVVFVKDKIIPIDSKFSLENYNRLVDEKNPTERDRLEKAFVNDLKLRIQETAKYVQPDQKTMNFAFMFIPHEAIYYDLLTNRIGALKEDNDNLIQRAASKYHVIIVSPTSFLAYLQTVLQGLNAMKIEEKTRDIIKNIGTLQKHLKSYEEYHLKLGNSLGTVVSHFNTSHKEFNKINKDVVRITDVESEFQALALDKPDLDE